MLYVARGMLYVVFLLVLVIWYLEFGTMFMDETSVLDGREVGRTLTRHQQKQAFSHLRLFVVHPW